MADNGFHVVPKEAITSFPDGMPRNRRWISERTVINAMHKTFFSRKSKTQKFAQAVSEWVFDPNDWKNPVRINAYLLDESQIGWVKAIIIWYHGVEPTVKGQFIYSPGYSC